MKRIRFLYRGKELEGIVIKEFENFIEVKLKNGYNVIVEDKDIKILEEFKEKEGKIEIHSEEEEGEIVLLATGGTIASKVDYETGAVKPQISAKELIEFIPEIKKLDKKIETKTIMSIFSEDMDQQKWEVMVKAAYDEMKKGKKVIILHGTDTMHYSAAALAFGILSKPSPIVFVGAQRSSDRPSTDARDNLMNAIYTSLQPIGESVIVMHASSSDEGGFVHRGVRARKMHTSRRDAFQSVNDKPLAYVSFIKETFEKINSWISPSTEISYNNGFSKNVAMVYYYPGMDADLLQYFSKYKGIVLMGTGLGHVGLSKKEFFEVLQDIAEKNIVVMVSQTIFGRINMNVYSTGRKLKEMGIVGNLLDVTPEAAFVKLSWLLYREKEKEKIKELFVKNFVREFSERSIFF